MNTLIITEAELIIKGDAHDGGYDDMKAFNNMKKLKTVVFKTTQKRDNISFRNCKKLKKVVLVQKNRTWCKKGKIL